MATSYDTVYKRFLNITTDFNLAEFDDYTLSEMLKEWLKSAVVKVRTSNDLSCNDDDEVFENDLSQQDIELLAMGMKLARLDQRISSNEYTDLFVGGKEEKFYSPGSQLSELRALREDIKLEMQKIYTYSTYANNSYFDE